MKVIKTIIKSLTLSLIVSGIFSSCSDWLSIEPKDEMILEDYWKNASDVEASVMGCYRAMIEKNCIERLIVWGELRSDNLAPSAKNSNETQRQLMYHNIMTSNSYSNWSSIYTAINNCNTVLHYAPGVVKVDPNFDTGTLQTYQAEALTLRALLYFYLVRVYRDVPYITTPTKDDTERFNYEKSGASYILERIIEDLELSRTYAVEKWNSSIDSPDNKGRITKQAVRAILADVYLWTNQYDKCISVCNEFLQANKLLKEEERLKLVDAEYMLREVYYNKNSSESIFELQFSTNLQNSTLFSLYGGIDTDPSVSAPNIEGSWEFTPGASGSPFGLTDNRARDYVKPLSVGALIYKYVGTNRTTDNNNKDVYASYRNNTPNWIFYRLSDIYLMRAEALAEKGTASDLKEALLMVNYTFMRSNPQLGNDSLKLINYPDQTEIRKLILEERRREFVFEGKRWFDLVRFSERNQSTADLVNFVSKALNNDASILAIARNKLAFIDALYMPINIDEMKRNPNLKQNPFYETTGSLSTN